MKPQRVEISYKTIVFTVLFLLGLFVLWSIRDILILLFICFVSMEALNPTVTKLEKYKIPRPAAIILIYVIVIAVFVVTIAGIVPILIDQTSELIRVLPSAIQNVNLYGLTAIDLSSQLKILESIPAQVTSLVISTVSNLFSGFVVLVITFYLLLERQYLDKHSRRISSDTKTHTLIAETLTRLEKRLGNWVNGELILMTVIGLMAYLGYLILGLPYAVPLAIMAGMLEIVPNIGPIITTVLAAAVGLTVSPLTALFTVLWGIVIHQSENNFITPKIMKETVGINPIITILTIATGAKLAGIGGALLAVPIYLTIETILTVLWSHKK